MLTAKPTVRCFTIFSLGLAYLYDNGPQFVSAVFEELLKQNGVKHVKSAPYYPSFNEHAECFMPTFKCTNNP